MATLHYFHVHNGKGLYCDGYDYEIVFACDEHMAEVDAMEDSEYIYQTTEDDMDESCDRCHVKP